jgi:hypothetical protein
MDSTIVLSGRDSILVGVPLVGFLFAMVFRADQAVSTRRALAKRPPRRGVDREGREIYSDPDGTTHHAK